MNMGENSVIEYQNKNSVIYIYYYLKLKYELLNIKNLK